MPSTNDGREAEGCDKFHESPAEVGDLEGRSVWVGDLEVDDIDVVPGDDLYLPT